MGTHVLSKSSFLKGVQCEKQLYLYKHHYNWQDPISESQQAIFDRGTNVGKLAQDLFPGGINVAPPNPFQYDKSAKLTLEKIKDGAKVLYEASFIYNGVLVALDILVKVRGKWKAYEVKSSTSISETNIIDASVQYYVIKNSGIDLTDISIVYLNNQYVRQGELDIEQLFNKESVLADVLKKQDFIEEKIKRLKSVINGKNIPEIGIGPHCNDPYGCAFLGYCWKDVPEYSVFNISGLKTDKKFEEKKKNPYYFSNEEIKHLKLSEGSTRNTNKIIEFINTKITSGIVVQDEHILLDSIFQMNLLPLANRGYSNGKDYPKEFYQQKFGFSKRRLYLKSHYYTLRQKIVANFISDYLLAHNSHTANHLVIYGKEYWHYFKDCLNTIKDDFLNDPIEMKNNPHLIGNTNVYFIRHISWYNDLLNV